jgi:hypothetical protein
VPLGKSRLARGRQLDNAGWGTRGLRPHACAETLCLNLGDLPLCVGLLPRCAKYGHVISVVDRTADKWDVLIMKLAQSCCPRSP